MAVEHFVTLFDSGFLLQGLALHESLLTQGEPFTLWVVCMDAEVESVIKRLGYQNLKAIPLRQIEGMYPELLSVKSQRTRGEYCWTLTSFCYAAVMAMQSDIERVIYVDADVYFFGPASRLLDEMDSANADVLLTEHAYAPKYMQESTAGIYCVQFLPIRNSEIGRCIMKWWQERCIEWCFARHEDGKFGDQKYLDDWPLRWGRGVVVLAAKHLTLAPWNVNYYSPDDGVKGLYHFHGLRVYDNFFVRLWLYYKINAKYNEMIYSAYIASLKKCHDNIIACGCAVSLTPMDSRLTEKIKRFIKAYFLRCERWEVM